jgi:hypothetical protein
MRQGAQGGGPCYEYIVSLDVGPTFPGYPSHQILNQETCEWLTCPEGSVVCPEGDFGVRGCYSLEFICGNGGTFDASNCQCICPLSTSFANPEWGCPNVAWSLLSRCLPFNGLQRCEPCICSRVPKRRPLISTPAQAETSSCRDDLSVAAVGTTLAAAILCSQYCGHCMGHSIITTNAAITTEWTGGYVGH